MSKPDWLFPSAGKSQCAGCDTLRSDLSKREAELDRAQGMVAAHRDAVLSLRIKGTRIGKELSLQITNWGSVGLWLLGTAATAKAHDDKVAREAKAKAILPIAQYYEDLNAEEIGLAEVRARLWMLYDEARGCFEANAEQGGK